MSVVHAYMSRVQFPDNTFPQSTGTPYPNTPPASAAYEYKGEVVSTAINSLAMLVPSDIKGSVELTVVIGASGHSKLQFTDSPVADVIAGSATWIDVAANVAANTGYDGKPHTAYRIANTDGTCQLLARAQ